jgi:hypothetical protein
MKKNHSKKRLTKKRLSKKSKNLRIRKYKGGADKEPLNAHTLFEQQKLLFKPPTLKIPDPQEILEKKILHNKFVKEEIPNHITLKELSGSLKSMGGEQVSDLFTDASKEQKSEPHIEFTIVKSPLSNRLIANVTKLIWNGDDLLEGEPIMLYQSSGQSRGTGLDNYWMPYLGEVFTMHPRMKSGFVNFKDERIVKLEDKYLSVLSDLFEIGYDIPDKNKPLIIDIFKNLESYNKYKRFIYKKYLIASFLLSSRSEDYISDPVNKKYIREYTKEEIDNSYTNFINKIRNDNVEYIPMTREIIDEIIKAPPPSGKA